MSRYDHLLLLIFVLSISFSNAKKISTSTSQANYHWDGYGMHCAGWGGTCAVPAGMKCGIRYVFNPNAITTVWDVANNIPCYNYIFGVNGNSGNCYIHDCWWLYQTCANEGGVCNVPAGQKCDISFGVANDWATKPGLTGSVACNRETIGAAGLSAQFRGCKMENCQEWSEHGTPCSALGAKCELPDGLYCTVKYCGGNGQCVEKTGVSCRQECSKAAFGNPSFEGKCYYTDCTEHFLQIILNLRDSTTGQLIPSNVSSQGTVTFKELFGSGQTIQATFANNAFTAGLKPGRYQRTINVPGYAPYTTEVEILEGGVKYVELSPTLRGWRIILSWQGSQEKDLDAILTLGGGKVVDFSNKNVQANGGTGTLDVDSTDGSQAETITVKNMNTGKGTYFVRNYSAANFINLSGAHVTVYKNDDKILELNVPSQPNGKNIWKVFEIDFASGSFNSLNILQ